ncbi:FAD/NAD(P)-binding oxidoreductase [Microbacterium lacus]|uniref:FAD-dependent oxidoreductase n=1 Tax=Microbacterium lacus TaxID=415217 RepID=A0ABN2FX45_9MICO
MSWPESVVVVGAGIAGYSTAESLRSLGYNGPLTLVSGEAHLPYNRPPLSKGLLAGAGESVFLTDRIRLAQSEISFLSNRTATALNADDHLIRLDEEWTSYGTLVIATGVRARELGDVPGASRVRTLRTLDDAIGIFQALRSKSRVAVVGGGVLGCELAATVRNQGHYTTLITRNAEVGIRALGSPVNAKIRRLLEQNGILVRTNVNVHRVHSTYVEVSDGGVVDADLVIAAIGARPETSWLVGSGLDLRDGIACDERGRAAADIYAVGDVARWHDPETGNSWRSEIQSSAVSQAAAAAAAILGQPAPSSPSPLMWTELFGTRVTAVGATHDADAMIRVAGDLDGDRFVAEYFRSSRSVGLIGWNMPREFREARARMAVEAARKRVPS